MSFFDRLISDELVGFVIIERSARDRGYELVTYQYPDLEVRTARVLHSRLSFEGHSFSRIGSTWHYSFTLSQGLPSSTLPNTSALSVVVLSKAYCPDKFTALAGTLASIYASSGSPPKVVEAWLLAFVKNSIPASLVPSVEVARKAGAPASWSSSAFNHSDAVSKPAGLRDLLAAVGVESILLWTALLLKKRVAVYGDSFASVSRAVELLPHLVSHRAAVETDKTGATAGADAVVSVDLGVPLYPLVSLRYPWAVAAGEGAAAPAPLHAQTREDTAEGLAAQLLELTGEPATGDAEGGAGAAAAPGGARRQTHYIAGFTDPSVASARGLWDVCLDLVGGSVAVSDEAAGVWLVRCTHERLRSSQLRRAAAVMLCEAVASQRCPPSFPSSPWSSHVIAESVCVPFSSVRPQPAPPQRSYILCPSAADLALSSLHKDVAKAMMAAVADEAGTDASVAAAVRTKTDGIIASLRALFPSGIAANAEGVAAFQQQLRDQGQPEPVQRFLWSLALAELGGASA